METKPDAFEIVRIAERTGSAATDGHERGFAAVKGVMVARYLLSRP